MRPGCGGGHGSVIRFVLNFFGAVFSWFVTAAVFLALIVGGVFWIYSRDLPSHEVLASYTPKTISRIYSGEGRLIDEFAEERRIFVPSEEIPDLVKHAFVSAEDKFFYTHHGYDPRGMAAAAVEAVRTRGESVRGASTITQQVMKNFLLDSSRSVERKVKELILATRLERTLSKDKILELYLNEIFLGQNSAGVAAAAQTYFNKPLGELAPHEAALLAAMPQAPSRSVVRDKDRITERRNYVLREMWQNGYLTEAEYKSEAAQPLRSVQNGDYPAFRQSLPPRDYFTDEIRRQLSAQFGEDEFFGGGLSIRATVEPQLQQIAAKALQDALERYDRGLGLWRGTGETIPAEELASEDRWRAALAKAKVPRDIEGWYPAVVLSLGKTDAEIGIEGIAPTEAEPQVIPAKDVQWARKMMPGRERARQARVAADLLAVGDVVLVRRMTEDGSGKFIRWTLRQVPAIQGGFMAMDVTTGRVHAMQGGFSYQASVFNRATQAQRQPGSSVKPYVLATAVDQGIGIQARRDGSDDQEFPDRPGLPVVNSGGASCPACTLTEAITRSLNTTYYGLAYEVGPENVRDTILAATGLPDQWQGGGLAGKTTLASGEGGTGSSIGIGEYEMRPIDQAQGFATLAAGGDIGAAEIVHHHALGRGRQTGGIADLPGPATRRIVQDGLAMEADQLGRLALLRVRKSVVKAIDEAVTKLVDKFLETNTPPAVGKGGGGLMPALASGELRCIGSTTFQEYRGIFEKDRALARRFQKIDVVEPTVGEAVEILRGLKPKYEKHHGVRYDDEAIQAAVDLSVKHIHDRLLPDKAIDLIDEAGARQRLLTEDLRKANIDIDTARRLFTLICVLHIKG